jgi:hypothetical protein
MLLLSLLQALTMALCCLLWALLLLWLYEGPIELGRQVPQALQQMTSSRHISNGTVSTADHLPPSESEETKLAYFLLMVTMMTTIMMLQS